jgi:hypothetical protein
MIWSEYVRGIEEFRLPALRATLASPNVTHNQIENIRRVVAVYELIVRKFVECEVHRADTSP